MSSPSLITARELRAKLQISPRTLQNWIRDGRVVPTVQVGRVHRFDYEKVVKALSDKTKSRR